MTPIRMGDGTVLSPKGMAEVRKGDGTVLWSAEASIPDSDVYYPADEGSGTSLSDGHGNIDATVNGAGWGTGAGVGDTYLSYSSGDEVETDSALGVSGADARAFGVWFNPDDASSDQHLLNHGDSSGSDLTALTLRIFDGDLRCQVFSSGDDFSGGFSVSSGEWQLGVISYDEGNQEATLYYADENGVQSTTGGFSNPLNTPSTTLRIGYDPDSGGERYYQGGGIDNIPVWYRHVTESDVQEFYDDYKSLYGISSRTEYFANNAVEKAFQERAEPSGHYISSEDTTYIAYHSGTDAYVAAYDHNAGTWNGPVLAGSGNYDDTHGCPELIVDDSGYIHVWFNGHSSQDMFYVRSDSTHDISSWSVMDSDFLGSVTYPKLAVIDGNIWAMFRAGSGSGLQQIVYSSDNGATWSSPFDFIDFSSTNDWIYLDSIDVSGSHIHGMWHISDRDDVDNNRRNWYYGYLDVTDPDNPTFHNIDGTELTTPLTKSDADSNALAASTPSDNGLGIGFSDMAVDSSENPYLSYNITDSSTSDVYRQFLYHDGSSWQGPSTIATVTDRHQNGTLLLNSATDITHYVTDANWDIRKWSWNGSSWTDNGIVADATGTVDDQYMMPRGIRDGQDDLAFVFSERNMGDRTTEIEVYAWDTTDGSFLEKDT